MLHVFLHVKWPRSISVPRVFQHLWPEITTFFSVPKNRGLRRCLAHGIGTRTLRQRSQDVALDLSGLRLGRICFPPWNDEGNTLWLCQQFAIENGHRNSGFSH